MPTMAERLQERNQEIGLLLAQARKLQRRSVTECAAFLATSRRRYSAIERGDASVSAAELEVLISYLEIPLQILRKDEIQHVHVQALPGKTLQVVVEVQG